MRKRERKSLEWKEKPFPELVRLAWPIAVSTLSYSVMTLTDTLFVGRLGASALAGVGLGGVAAFTLLCFGFGLLRGVKTLVSQGVGAGRAEGGRWLSTGIVVALALGAVCIVVGHGLSRVLPLLADSDAAGAAARSYFGVRILGAPLVLVFVALREHRYGMGDTRSAMIASLVANGTNVVLDWLLIVVLDYGVAGAAWSTVVGHGVELLVLVLRTRGQTRLVRVGRVELRALFRVGAPIGLQFWLEVGSFALLTTIVSSLGDVQLAAHQIALQVVHFSFLPCMALAEAASTLAGQAVGAGEVRLVRKVARLALVGAVLYTGLCTLALIFCAPLIAGAFTEEPALLAVTIQLLWIASLFQVADGAAMVARAVLRGTGDVRFPATVGILCAWLATPPLAWGLGHAAGLGAAGGWVGLSVEIIAAAAIFWWRLERCGWLPVARRARALAV